MREDGAAPVAIDVEGWVCPMPLRDAPNIVMGHGGGGAMSGELIEHLFLPAFGSAAHADLGDSAVVTLDGARLAFSTDSFVVKPIVFPGGTIGELAVNGTVNDLAMSGARPMVLSTAFILEEGTALADIARIAQAVGTAALAAEVQLVTGDTKVVDAGHGDGIYINTAGIGVVAPEVDIRPQRARPGDVVLVSGDIGVHGVAVLSCREGLEFGTTVLSDTAPLHGLVAAMLATGADVHVLRDPTRGGVAASLNEIARAAGVGVSLDERQLPVPDGVRDACGLLGLDPMYVANEGKLLAFVAPEDADRVLATMREHPLGAQAAAIGRCVAEHPGMVVARTALGGTRVVDLPAGEQLPRIC
ncbi:hydrogenase expression/formation protein HypE [Nocardia gamkensis]|uniref:Hydrogenase expression/formation protein HypE n=1 Tax=Nocardia gamkensis TaxID=352869 RepID=A0A7X6R2W1_9NOCA|nr:hydrogenase expression/formation protein HypE [Nocardia gamkensis]NKY26647.1 hydrogenase expression/formation protein HypE [Nocardia gamkensis]NQE71366.1 Hydrogenase expression/formation protein HupE [Nocardia gamkensis]